MPDTCHGLCTWHLIQNGIKHLGNLMKGDSHFLSDLKKYMYTYEEEDKFEAAWLTMIQKYDVHENTWLKSMYAVRKKWATCFMKQAFTLGMQSTQLSESLNSDFKTCMKPDVRIVQFFKLFERVVDEKRYNELKCEFDAWHKLPRLNFQHSSILKQVANIYTLPILDLFQREFNFLFTVTIRHRNETQTIFEYALSVGNQEGEWRVMFDPVEKNVSCSCRKFEPKETKCTPPSA